MSCQGSGLGAPACAAPFYGTPGCCECPPGPCDNAWDGYCEHKGRCQAFWHKIGTGAFRHGCFAGDRYYIVPEDSCGACAAPSIAQPESSMVPSPEPSDELPPAPAPVAEETARWWSMPWVR